MSAITEIMENISQKDLDKIVSILEKIKETELAERIKSAEIIPALYVMNYLESVDDIRKKSKVIDEHMKAEGLKRSDGSPHMRNDLTTFQKNLNKCHTGLELDYVVRDTEKTDEPKFEGMCELLGNALKRKILICDFDDSKFPDTKIGRCENDEHWENIDGTPIIPLPDNLKASLDAMTEHWDKIIEGTIEPTKEEKEEDFEDIETKEPYVNYFNPANQKLTLCFDADYESKKYINKYPVYTCSRCIDEYDGEDSCDISCDRDF